MPKKLQSEDMTEDPIRIFTSLMTARMPTDSNLFTLDGRIVYVIDDEMSTHLSVSESFYEGNRRAAHDQIETEFVAQFTEIANLIGVSWGPPNVQASPVQSFPHTDDAPKSFEDEFYYRGAIALAYWNKPGYIAYVCVEHQDSEVPYCLLLGVKHNITHVA